MAQVVGTEDFMCYSYNKDTTKRDFILKKVKADACDTKYKDDAFMVVDVGEVLKKHETWLQELPNVTPFYTVKCMPYLPMVKLLAELGCGFDCASPEEIDKVLSLGVSPSRIVYSHTMKQKSYLAHASENNVDLMTFDDETELLKVKEVFPRARLLLRLSINDQTAQIPFGFKFGCHHKNVKFMLEFAKEHGLQLVGTHFHIGSGSQNPEMFERALNFSRKVFDVGNRLGFKMNVLNIGGGFPGSPRYPNQFGPFAASIREAIAINFPPDSGVTIIAEPGRYYAESSVTLVTNLIGIKTRQKSSSTGGISMPSRRRGKRPMLTRQASSTTQRRFSKQESIGHFAEMSGIPDVTNPFTYDYMYFVNDGLFSSFLRNVVGYPVLTPRPLKEIKEGDEEYKCMIVGETCPEEDSILDECMLPKMQIGDWLVFEDMGAYTCMATGFNGFTKKFIYYAVPENAWPVVQPMFAKSVEILVASGKSKEQVNGKTNGNISGQTIGPSNGANDEQDNGPTRGLAKENADGQTHSQTNVESNGKTDNVDGKGVDQCYNSKLLQDICTLGDFC